MNSLVNDKIKLIKLEKENIKSILTGKGIDMSKVPFSKYHTKIADSLSEFTRLEYIIAKKASYIDTGYELFLNTNWEIEMDYEPSDVSYNFNNLFGYTGDADKIESWIDNTGATYLRYNGTKSAAATATTARQIYNFKKVSTKTTLTIGSTAVNTTVSNQAGAYGNCLLLTDGGKATFGAGKLYSAKIYNNSGVLVRDFVPVIQNTTKLVGLYDLITKGFFPSATSANFEPGPSTEITYPEINDYILKTGYYNQMTSATSPAAYGITATDTIHFIEQWQIFDDDWTTTGTINCGPNQSWSVTQDLLEAKIIPTKITVKQYSKNNTSNTFSGTITIDVSSDNVQWTTFGTVSYKENNQQSDSYFDIINTSLSKLIRYVRFTMKADSNNTHSQFGANGFRIIEWKEHTAGSNNQTWVAKTGALAVLPEPFTTVQVAGDTGGKAGSEIFKFDSPIRNFNGHMVIKGSGGDATYRQFGINVECYLDSTCSQSNMIHSGSQHTQTTSETTFNFSLGDDIEIYGIKYTIWSADASNNISNVGTTTCTEAMITSWEELVGGSGSSGGSYIPAGIDAIYNTSWEALAGAGHSPYTSKVFDSGNNNKKGVYLCIRNASAATVYGSNDQSDWQTVISGNTGGSNDGATGTPKNLVSEEVDYRYFKATCTGYNNGHPTTISWGVFEVEGSVSYIYPNYTINYGQLQTYEVSTTKSDANRVITFPDGIIPLTLSIDLKFGATNSESHRRFTIDGLFYAAHGGLNGIANSDFVQSDIDLESYYGDISAIPSSLTYYGWSTEANREVKGTITITKWLEPSSGSGSGTDTQVISLPLSNPTVQTYTSEVIDCGIAKACNYVWYKGGGSMEYVATTYIQGSSDNSLWTNVTSWNSGTWGNTATGNGDTGSTKYRYWRIQTVVTKSANYCGQMTTIYA